MKNNFHVFIPARGGSKSIKDKNIQKILDLPLVERTIQLALKRFDKERVVISSDSEKILKIGKKYSISIHLRSQETASDNASTESALMEWLLDNEEDIKWIVLLEPTSPFVNLNDLDKAMDLCLENDEKSCVYSITEIRHTDNFLNQRILKNNQIEFLFEKERKKNKLKQAKQKTYKFGNIALIQSKEILNKKSFFSSNSLTFIIPYLRSINIDSEEELFIARSLANYDQKLYLID